MVDRVDKFLDDLSKEWSNIFKKAEQVRLVMRIFPEVDWIDALKRAAERQEDLIPGASSMRDLARHMAPGLLGI